MTAGKEEFERFLERERKTANPEVDWQARKEQWIANLNKLYEDVEGWLEKYTQSEDITIVYNEKEIHEEKIGSYKVKQMTIILADEIIFLQPVGTILIGASGRVDIVGRKEEIKLILTDKAATGITIKVVDKKQNSKSNESKTRELAWKITSNPPRIIYTELNQDTFLSCLIKAVNG